MSFIRRSARIASLEIKKEEEPKMKHPIKKIVIKQKESSNSNSSGNDISVQKVSDSLDKVPDWVTVRWIQEFRKELSLISKDPNESSKHIVILSEMIKPFPTSYGGIDDLFGDVLNWSSSIIKEPDCEEYYNCVRNSIEECYTILEKMEKRLSD
jgi:hypothetical protein